MSPLLILSLMALGSICRAREPVQPPSPARELRNLDLIDAPTPEFEHYYILIFGAQSTPKVPRYTHTWLTAVKTYEKPGEAPTIRDVQTISWGPSAGVVRLLRFKVEPGHNSDLASTMAWARRSHAPVSLWGPYETWQGLYRRIEIQSEYLRSGAIGYQCTDGFGEAARLGNGSNCFHAVSDMDPEFDRRQYPLFFYGNPASANIVRQIMRRPVLIHPNITHDWLIDALGLCPSELNRRRYHGRVVEFSPEAVRARSAQH